MPVEATPETFQDLTRDGPVLVDFWGPRCAPCLAMMPAIEEMESASAGRVRVVKVNAPDNRQVCRDLRVFGLPTYILMRDGTEIERLSGDVAKADLERAFATLSTAEGGEAT
jgi:thioredoxin-like negative regulator of GroEL